VGVSRPAVAQGTPLAKSFAKFWSGKNELYDYSSLYKLDVHGHDVYVLESVTDAVDDLRVYNAAGRQVLSNLGGTWSR
jgi:hypothetical protein